MSKHTYYEHRGDCIEAVGKENKRIAEAKRMFFTDHSDTEVGGGIHGSIMFAANVPNAHLLVDTIVVSGLDEDDEIFYNVLEEVSLSDEPNGPDENHYSFTAERITRYAGTA